MLDNHSVSIIFMQAIIVCSYFSYLLKAVACFFFGWRRPDLFRFYFGFGPKMNFYFRCRFHLRATM